ncbi:MAG: hypothetical protein AAFP03_09160 [Cyanobacteria bacterium J06598_3]
MDNKNLIIQYILVPAGAEHWAVKRGLRQVKNAPQLVAVPAGPQGLRTFLETGADRHRLQAGGVLLMGLGGGLLPKHNVGDVVVLERVWNGFEGDEVFECDPELVGQITERLAGDSRISTGVGVTCDRVITTVQEKKVLRDRYSADVVDMESVVLIKALSSGASNGQTVILRVISDNAQHDLPYISEVISSEGTLQIGPLALMLLKRPLAALRFVQGALTGLKVLESIAPIVIKVLV